MSFIDFLPYFALILCTLVALIVYFSARTTKWKIIGSVLMALSLSVCAYMFVPKGNYDLVRHHNIVQSFVDVNTYDEFLGVFGKIDLEPIPKMMCFIVAKIGDYNLLQAAIVLVGYFFLFYMLIDYNRRVGISNIKFFPIMLLVIFGQHILFYFSGLYNYFAINLFAFAIYLDYVKCRHRISWLFYLVSPFIHSSMFLPLGVLILFKALREKFNKKFLILFLVGLFFFSVILNFLIESVNMDYLKHIKDTYDIYLLNNDKMISLYDGFYLFMTIAKITLALLMCYIQRRDKSNKRLRSLTLLMTLTIIVLSISSVAITRFSSLVLFMSIPLLCDAVKNNNVSSRCILFLMTVLGVIFAVYGVHIIAPLIVMT